MKQKCMTILGCLEGVASLILLENDYYIGAIALLICFGLTLYFNDFPPEWSF